MTKDEALKLALEALDIVKIHFTQNRHVNEAITAIKQARSAPDCKETGVCIQTGLACFVQSAQPAPALEGRDWSLLEATQESLREHMAEIKRLKAAHPAVPDAIGQNEDELPAYVAGWNDCRQAMLEMMK